jgi:ribosome-associated protein
MTTETAAKRDTQKLQRAIVDGLEDVKAQDIQVFDTEHLSSLFERVIVASGTSNRQTKALAASVRDAVREAGFPKPRVEGEANGEWIIVDCAQAVVHIMQPTFRSYYNLEELWGEKPIRLKFGSNKPAVKAVAIKEPAPKPTTGRKMAVVRGGVKPPSAARTATGKLARKKAPERPIAPERPVAPQAPVKRLVVGKKPATKKAPAVKPRGATAVPAKAPARAPARAPVKAPAKVVAKKAAGKAPAKKAAPRKA